MREKMKFPPVKKQLIIFLSLFLIYLSLKEKDIAFIWPAVFAVIFTVALDSLFGYLKERKIAISDSSVITGLIIGFVLSGDQPCWITISAALAAILSKQLIQVNRKHLFNPAAFGIIFVMIVFGAQTQWKGTYSWYVLAPCGIYFIRKINKLEILFGYLLVSLGFSGAQALLQKIPFMNIFGYLSYFFIFIMLIEPKTTPIKPAAKWVFGALAAVLVLCLNGIGVKLDAELCGLLLANLAVPLLNKI